MLHHHPVGSFFGRAPSSFALLPRQSYSPKIVRAAGPGRVAEEKNIKISDLFLSKKAPDNKPSPAAEKRSEHTDEQNKPGAFR